MEFPEIPTLGNPFVVDTWLTIVVGRCTRDNEVLMLNGSLPTRCPKCGANYQCTILQYNITNIDKTPIGIAYSAPKKLIG